MPRPEPLIEQLSAYLDGELDEAERRRVEAGLAASPEARAQLEALRTARDALATLPRPTAPAELRERVRRQIERASLLESSAPRPTRILRLARWTLAAAAVVLAAVVLRWSLEARRPARPVAVQPAPQPPQPAPQPAVATARPGPADDARPDTAAVPTTTPVVQAPPPAYLASVADAAGSGRAGQSARSARPAEASTPPHAPADAGSITLQPSEPPRVQVVVAPSDERQYAEARQVLRWWAGAATAPPASDPMHPDVEGLTAAAPASRPSAARPLTLASPSTPLRTRLLLDRLRAAAPQGVRVTLSFAPGDLDTVRAMLDEPADEPISRLLTMLDTPAPLRDANTPTSWTREPTESRQTMFYAMQYHRSGQAATSRGGATRSSGTRLTALDGLDAGLTALRWFREAPRYALAARQTVERTARELLQKLREELRPVRVELRLLPPTRPASRPARQPAVP